MQISGGMCKDPKVGRHRSQRNCWADVAFHSYIKAPDLCHDQAACTRHTSERIRFRSLA